MARGSGFCYGVKRAVQLAENAISTSNKPIYSLGPLVHNQQMVEFLRQKGLEPRDSIDELSGGRVVIRAHGVSPLVFFEAERRGLEVIDATCPRVKKGQKLASSLANRGYPVLIVGSLSHPEVQALIGWANGQAIIIENQRETDNLPHLEKAAIIAQTTESIDVFAAVVEQIRRKVDYLLVYNTICEATWRRQKAARELARRVEAMVVVGGRQSSNTTQLARICLQAGVPTYHVESAQELRGQWFKGLNRVGVTAGASTPEWIIEEVVTRMSELNQENIFEAGGEHQGSAGLAAEPVSACSPPTSCDDSLVGEPEKQASSNDTVDNEEKGEGAAQEQLENQDQMEAQLAEGVKEIRRGEIVTGTVVQINENEVLVDVGGKSEGIIPLSELSARGQVSPREVVQVGDSIAVYVLKVENEEGHPILSKKRADREVAWEKLEEAFKNQTRLEAPVIEVVKGGLLVDVGIKGFVPASLVERGYVEDLNSYLGKKLRLKVIEVDRRKNKAVLSQKAVLEEEFAERRKETWDSLAEGQIRHGVVRRLTNFGAFIDIGAVDGLLHVSEMSWGRVEHPSDLLHEGQEVDVKVLEVDRERGRISLGMKYLQPNPWDTAEERYPVGSIVNGKVLRTASFGAFVEVEPGIEGLVHISQLADFHVAKTEDVVSVGDVVSVKVLSVDSKAQRMSLSLREAGRALPEKATEEREAAMNTPANHNTNEGGVRLGELFGDLFEQNSRH